MADKKDYDVRSSWVNKSSAGGYPEGNSRYSASSGHTLQPSDHFRTTSDGQPIGVKNRFITGKDMVNDRTRKPNPAAREADDSSYLVKDKQQHFTRDWNDPNSLTHPVSYPDGKGGLIPVFSGSTTDVNPTHDQKKQEIITKGLEFSEMSRITGDAGLNNKDFRPPLSPLLPFTRMGYSTNTNDPQITNISTYNRFHIPVADLEHRKAFRHVLFTRPECYVMCRESGKVSLCQQTEFDEDFNSSYSRMPYITKMLAPVYVVGTFGKSNLLDDNFNYLLSNRFMGLSVSGATLSVQDGVTKSIQGYTVAPGMHYEGRQGSTISVTFRDTKYLEVYEYIRLWMIYIWKRKYGEFSPSFNGYKYLNSFPPPGEYIENLHPFDRALDYTCSMFDYVLDETDTFIKYWCKYYGLYPIDVQTEGLNNTNNGPLTSEMTVTVTFRYQYKLENVTRSLVEFNYNAGVCDNLGRVKEDVKISHPFLLQDKPTNYILPYYLGAAGAFAGTPYVVLLANNKDLTGDTDSGKTIIPSLRFSPLTNDTGLDARVNMGLTNVANNSAMLARSDLSNVADNASETEGSDKQAYDDALGLRTLANKQAEFNQEFDDKLNGAVDSFIDKWIL